MQDDMTPRDDHRRPVALITGGSRGIGAATALALAERGYDLVITYRNKAARAEAVAAQIDQRGGRALTVAADITQPEDRARLSCHVSAWSGRLDLLVLNASGGLERDLVGADAGYPMHLNRDAQLAMMWQMLPVLAAGGTVVFVTSHWAHLYGRVAQFDSYEPVAASKHAGERALRDEQDALAQRGVRLLVVTGDLIAGTITPKLLARAGGRDRGLSGADERALPTTTDMGEAIAAAVTDPGLPSGHTVVVGRSLESLLR